jgi:threonine synthase
MCKNGYISLGENIDVCVPTGNFGNIFACYIAKKMGLPVGKLICASNENNVLTEFFETGRYNKIREFKITRSPSMDILISSNLERLISLTYGTDKNAEYMSALSQSGEYTIPQDELSLLANKFSAGYCNDEESLSTIGNVFKNYKYLMDTHTAVAWNVSEKLASTANKTVILSTASPYKFSASVLKALGACRRAFGEIRCHGALCTRGKGRERQISFEKGEGREQGSVLLFVFAFGEDAFTRTVSAWGLYQARDPRDCGGARLCQRAQA